MDSPPEIAADFQLKALWKTNHAGKELGQAEVCSPAAESINPAVPLAQGVVSEQDASFSY